MIGTAPKPRGMKLQRTSLFQLLFFQRRSFCSSLTGNVSDQSLLSITKAQDTSKDSNKHFTSSNNNNNNKTSVCLPTVFLPEPLQQSLDKVLSCYPKKPLVQDGLAMLKYVHNRRPLTRAQEQRRKKREIRVTPSSLQYSDKPSLSPPSVQTPLRYGCREAIAYAASRVHANYGVTLRLFKEVADIDPTFKPETMLDFGSGLGTAVWAAYSVWGNSIYEYQTIDSSPDMGELAQVLRMGGDKLNSYSTDGNNARREDSSENISGVYFRQYLSVSNKVHYDLVVSAYSLSEIPTLSLWKQSLASLWKKTKQYLVLVELGTPAGFDIISEAREFLLKAHTWSSTTTDGSNNTMSSSTLEGYVVAPCPHDQWCPLIGDKSPCRFGQRVQLSLAEHFTSLRKFGFHIEPFSYVIFKKGIRETTPSESRLLLPVKKRTRHVICRLCTPNGSAPQVVLTKTKQKELYREARKKQWGDNLAVPSDLYLKSTNNVVIEDNDNNSPHEIPCKDL